MKFLHTLAAVVALALSVSACAFPIANSGDGFIVVVDSTGDIIATYEGNSAGYSNDLYLVSSTSDPITGPAIFNNHASPVGSTANLGSFALGTELLFRLRVNDTSNSFYTGPASRNPDNAIHARVQQAWKPDTTLVSFEDLYGGPFNYNDLSFSFKGTAAQTANSVPEPASLMLLGIGLVGLTSLRRRKDQNRKG